MKIALVHDHLAQDGGGERVLKAFAQLFPDAPIYTLVYNKKTTNSFFNDKEIHTSFLQHLPFGVRRYQWYLPFMPSAIEHLDLSDYDVILSSSSMFGKGVITRPDAVHICYCHTPTRFLWSDTHSYVRELQLPSFIKKLIPILLSSMRVSDKQMADRVDYFLANSQMIQQRIHKYYRRSSMLVYPPVDISTFSVAQKPESYYVTGGRLVSYKRFDIAVKAFSRLNMPLKIFGDGPMLDTLRAMAKDNVEFLGKVTDEEKADLYKNAIAFINPQVEDFGITAIESMASGRPVIAFAQGGTKEAILPGVTGQLFYEQTWEDLADTIIRFHNRSRHEYDPKRIRAHAEKFSTERFLQSIDLIVREKYEHFQNEQQGALF